MISTLRSPARLAALLILLAPATALAGVPVGGKAPRAAPAADEKPAPIRLAGHKAAATGLIARLKPGAGHAAALPAALDHCGLEVGCRFEGVPRLQRLVPRGDDALDAAAMKRRIRELMASGHFEYVEPDWQVGLLQQPTDSAFANGDLWGLRNTGQSGGIAGVDIDAVAAWAVTSGSPSVVVGVIDTGIRYTHQDLAANMWVNPGEIPGNSIDDDGNGYVDDVHGINAITGSGDPFDDNDHGTHCAGTIAASAFDAGRHVGVAYDVRVMGLKFLGANGTGSVSDAITCIEYAIDQGVDVLSNSWGGGPSSQALRDAIEAAHDAGILFVAAAGNSASDNDATPHFPSNYEVPNVVAVAAIDRRGALASFSSFGAGSVDLGAPGVAILSCTADSDSSYAFFNGTSMATPHVAGVAALIASRHPGAGVAEMKNRLLVTAAPLAALDGRVATGGMGDARAALDVAADGTMELRASTNAPLEAGATRPFFVTVTDLTPVTGASVSGSLDGGTQVGFLDNGVAPDETAGDGVYSANLIVPTGVSTTTLDVAATAAGKSPAAGSFPFAVSSPPANDDFANRLTLVGGTTQTSGTNRFASRETGEPLNPAVAGGRTVWWSWTAPANGSVTLSTTGSNFDTTLAVYRGSSLGGLTLVGSNDDSSGLQSAVTFTAVGGLVYEIQVDGYAGSTGEIQLNYPAPGTGGQSPVIVSQPVGRTVVLGDPVSLSVTASGAATLTYQWFLDGVSIPGATAASYSIPAADDDDQGAYTVTVTNGFGSVTSNPAYVAVDPVGLVPDNDEFANAESLGGSSGSTSGTNIRAGGETDEPDHAGVSAPLASVWYRWIAPFDGTLTVDTSGSDFDTALAAYTGTSLATLTPIASDDDSDGLQSRVTFQVNAGTGYRIAVDGSGSAEGQIALNYDFAPDAAPPPNDDFADRTLLVGSASTGGSNIGAGGESGEPSHAGASTPLASVWWSWTAPADGELVVSTLGSDFDTALAVYTGSAVGSLVEAAANDDFNELTSQVTLDVTAGTPYAIAVDGYATAEGNIALALQFTSADGNLLPLADAGEDLILTDLAAAEPVALDGSGSLDPDGTILSWQWTWPGGSSSGPSPTVALPLGTTAVTLTVFDDQGAADSDRLFVTLDTPATLTVKFELGELGERVGGGELTQTLAPGATATAPVLAVEPGWTFSGWSESFAGVFQDRLIRARYAPSGGGLENELFFDDFEAATPGFGNWSGYNGWNAFGDAGADEILEFSDDQTLFASIGFYPPQGGGGYTEIFRQTPVSGDRVVIEQLVHLTASTNGRDDPFYLTFLNAGLDTLGNAYFIPDGNEIRFGIAAGSGEWSLDYGVWYSLTFTLDLAANTVDIASFGSTFASGETLSDNGATLDFGGFSYGWGYDPANPGNGYLDVDDVRVAELQPPSAIGRLNEIEPNNDLAGAQPLRREAFHLESDPDVAESTTIPHLTVVGDGDGSFDYYRLELEAPANRLIADLDRTNFDTYLALWDASGTLVAANDDSPIGDGAGGSVSDLDSFLDLPALPAGDYLIGVGEFPASPAMGGFDSGSNSPDAGDRYELQVSTDGFLAPAPEIEVESEDEALVDGSSTLDFGDVVRGFERRHTLLLRNRGDAMLGALAPSLGGSHGADFATGPLAARLLPGARTRLAVDFNPGPTAGGERVADLALLNDDPDESPFDLLLQGRTGTALQVFQQVAADAGLGGGADPEEAPLGDDVPTILKYAFNLPLDSSGARRMPAGGVAGLPLARLEREGSDGTMRFEYVRRRASGLVYRVIGGDTLDPATFDPLPGTETVTPIDAAWERVIYEVDRDLDTQPTGFGQVEVGFP